MSKTRTKIDRYLIGLDLGQSQDYTAVCVINHKIDETWNRDRQEWDAQPATYRVGHLERIPLGTSYPDIQDHVAELVAATRERGDVALVIDYGHVGRAIYDAYRKAGLHPIAITIHGGQEVNRPRRNEYSVPKRGLVSTTKLLLQQERLTVDDRLKHADLLRGELQDFQIKVSAAGHDSYEARQGKHDDLVLSVATAVWYGEQYRSFKLAFA